jgi:hypothetical protein
MPDDPRHQTTPTRRRYLDRLGRVITDPIYIEARYVQERLARLTTKGVKAGRPWHSAVTVGELATATKLPPARVVEIVRDRIYLGNVTETDGPMEQWGVWQDGE